MDEARQLLDSLMGTHRNVDRREAKKKAGNNFKEDDVCKYYLVGFCPQHEELFRSTKKDVGKCYKVHSDAMKAEFESHPDRGKYQAEYEEKLRRYLEELVRWADDRVAREKRNIASANQQIQEDGPNEVARQEIKQLNDNAQALLSEAEDLADRGMLEESRHKMDMAEEIKQRAAHWEEKAKALRSEDVCEICGSRMESGDVSRARFRHQDGKIHLGYVKIREWLADIIARQKAREDRPDRSRRKNDAKEGREVCDGDRDRDRDRGDRGERLARISRSRSRDAAGGGGDNRINGGGGVGGSNASRSMEREGPGVVGRQGRENGRGGRGDGADDRDGVGQRADRRRDSRELRRGHGRDREDRPRDGSYGDSGGAKHNERDRGRGRPARDRDCPRTAERRRDSRSRHRGGRY